VFSIQKKRERRESEKSRLVQAAGREEEARGSVGRVHSGAAAKTERQKEGRGPHANCTS
jgi:hypothetical protein